jgi:hypothetical protein
MVEPSSEIPLKARSKDWIWLTSIAVLTVLLWQFPAGRYILYPFTILGTWFHEMGHGLTAMLLGAKFQSLQIFPNGSGIATHTGEVILGRFGQALVAAGGPMGPPIAGAVFIFSSRNLTSAKYGLVIFGLTLIASAVAWIQFSFGMMIILLVGAIVFLLSLQKPGHTQIFTIQFLGVQACISTFRDFNYLFTSGGLIAGQRFASDTSVIAQNLLLPFWFWGILIAGFSIYILTKSLRRIYRQLPIKTGY